MQEVLNDFKSLYADYVDTFLMTEHDVRSIIMGTDEALKNEEIYFSLGNNSFNYVVKSQPELLDKVSLASALADNVLASQLENLERAHIELLTFCMSDQLEALDVDNWFKIF